MWYEMVSHSSEVLQKENKWIELGEIKLLPEGDDGMTFQLAWKLGSDEGGKLPLCFKT